MLQRHNYCSVTRIYSSVTLNYSVGQSSRLALASRFLVLIVGLCSFIVSALVSRITLIIYLLILNGVGHIESVIPIV